MRLPKGFLSSGIRAGLRKKRPDLGLIVVDEAHNLLPAEPQSRAAEVVREFFRTIAAEGRKLGLFLIVVSQRPDKLDRMIVYAQTALCRWKNMTEYFGEEFPAQRCGHCDNCLKAAADVTLTASGTTSGP